MRRPDTLTTGVSVSDLLSVVRVGEVFGNYELIAHLKSGGMAELYLGRRVRPADNRIFAVKVVHPHYLHDKEHMDMFLDEAGLTVQLEHPNVVKVEEVGEDRGVPYLAMEYVHGCSLAQLLQALIRRRRRMSTELAVYLAMEVAEGLHAAHEAKGRDGRPLNVVHRDVSPQNVLLSHTGEIRLIDFGIAKSRLGSERSQTGISIKGKLRYMSPEHAMGHSVDRRADVYSLGIVLWEILTMRPLFWAKTDLGVLARVREPKIVPPSVYRSGIPEGLDDVVCSALDPNVGTRIQTATDFRRRLSRAMPLAEALDEEQVSHLLSVILGDHFDEKADALAVVEGKIGYQPKSQRRPRASATDTSSASDVLDALTRSNMDEVALMKESLQEQAGREEVITSAEQFKEIQLAPDPPEEATETMTQESLEKMRVRIENLRKAGAPLTGANLLGKKEDTNKQQTKDDDTVQTDALEFEDDDSMEFPETVVARGVVPPGTVRDESDDVDATAKDMPTANISAADLHKTLAEAGIVLQPESLPSSVKPGLKPSAPPSTHSLSSQETVRPFDGKKAMVGLLIIVAVLIPITAWAIWM